MSRNQIVGVGMDYSPMSKLAVRWAVENFVNIGDRFVVIHVSSKFDHPQKNLWENSGSPLIPLDEFKEMNVSKHYGVNKDQEILDMLDTASKTRKIYWGDPRLKLCEAVEDLKLNSLVVGSRGLGVLKRVLLGSVSDYIVTHATCPVTVVKGSLKLKS
ncbi:universal stress protein PHOS32 isoform X2 [Dioscorea cayenensis subsp. rotundata]|uniref:Universal stress protein PHOS32 isoform X2 n=1 Tax=Dioscorea cayennensis subsp. rotundata TaxID=55577 RepID=A0AB40BFN4_DIOCR|nr:universal stress protein PHOS32 isoform X2 [Dioscorea cayenensis subsp. rotundata]